MRLKNRKRYFTQWDKGQVLICKECPRGTQIHLSNIKSEFAHIIATDSVGTIITGKVTYINMNTLKIDFQATFSGKAYLN